MTDTAFHTPDEALAALLPRLTPVDVEQIPLDQAAGRILAVQASTDRDSPPCDVSSMDGYAVRLSDLASSTLPVAGEVRIGAAPPPMPTGSVLRIVTGAPVPQGADAVIRREDTDESDPARIRLLIPPGNVTLGQSIRRRGENAPANHPFLRPGTLLTSPAVGALAATGYATVAVHRRLRIAILNSGDELLDPSAHPQPWQIRDSNGPGLASMIRQWPWATLAQRRRVADERDALRDALQTMLDQADAVLTTGGVSAGDYDYLPQIVRDCGGQIIFHRLPVRPGKPILAAVTNTGKLIIGLPGNPVSALVGARRMAKPALLRLAGVSTPPPVPRVTLVNPDTKTLHLWWWRLIRLRADGQADLLDNRGSGDMIAAAASDGFVELPPDATGPGPWPLYRWE